ncbi:MAG: hypothetical protein KC656_04220 [Myxococcales bacterium]|nr:hypothetical protein [Myxococcales bacterium]MCB9693179.1 alpha-L-glutamate ligase [Alphaproteobacteria bacterium]
MIHVLYENEAWLPPLRDALIERGLPFTLCFTEGGRLDARTVPDGVWLNRMSPSSHTRGHQAGVVYARELLGVLERSGRRVLNGSRAFALEVSKVQQDAVLREAGILTPETIGVVGADALHAARELGGPFVTKHNQGGKGLGVQLFRTVEGFEAFVGEGGLEGGSPDGVVVLQRYIEPAAPFISRAEIVDGRFLYALRSSTVGGFELCPADACAVGDAFCPVGDAADAKFAWDSGITAADPLIQRYVAMMDANGLDVAGIEWVTDADGRRWTYDINGTTNFNSVVEGQAGVRGMLAIADLAARSLEGASRAA